MRTLLIPLICICLLSCGGGTVDDGTSSIVTTSLVYHLQADKAANGTGPAATGCPTTNWYDLAFFHASPQPFGFSACSVFSGWIGTGATGNPYALMLDGVNDYFQTAINVGLNIGSEFTIEMWIRPTDTTTSSYILDKDYDKWSIILGSGHVDFSHGTPEGSTAMAVSQGIWNHVAFAKAANGTSNNWRGYKNASEMYNFSRDFTLNTTSAQLNIGTSRPLSQNLYYQGGIAVIRIYNRGLSALEVQQNCRAESSKYGVACF